MKLFLSPSTNPHSNLALEEYLFEHSRDEFLIIYRNEAAVVIGKHQNAVAEVNIPYLEKNRIPFVRRFSGGGTVYHDINNINFSFITSGEDTKVIDFKKYAIPVIDFLKKQGINATLSDRHDILLNEKKISGHAAHAKNKRALHHGTLLFNANLDELSMCLRSNDQKFKSRAVKSVRSKVCNLYPSLSSHQTVEEFTLSLTRHLSEVFQVNEEFILSNNDRVSMESLAKSKYQTWEWNMGYSPEYSFSLDEKVLDQEIKVKFEVKKGVFTKIETDERNALERFYASLLNCKHHPMELREKLSQVLESNLEEVLKSLF